MTLEPHRLVTLCPLPADSEPGSSALLGLADDVDCAIVQVVASASPEVRGLLLAGSLGHWWRPWQAVASSRALFQGQFQTDLVCIQWRSDTAIAGVICC
jgi:hypothetical protein